MIKLKDYQKDALNKLKNGSILCGGVGSGKSLTSLAYYYDVVCDGYFEDDIPMKNPLDLYIITTARKRDTKEWEAECAKFLLPVSSIPSLLYSTKVVVDSWNNIQKYKDVKGAFFIFDEQRVVGSGAWSNTFIHITKSNKWILLSATPGDTWSDYIPVFIANGFYKNKTEFIREHAVYSYYSKYPKIEKYISQGKLIKYRNDILVKMDYETAAKRHWITELVDYDEIAYNSISENYWDLYEQKPIENASQMCYLLRKVSNDNPSRIKRVLDICSRHPKVIVFYNFDYERELLLTAGYSEGTVVAEWNGHDHQPIPCSDSWVYLVQYTAGAEGWNCTETDTIIFYSQSYSYKTMIQAAGRIDRLNTPYKDLYYYQIKSSSPIDISIGACLKRKKNFNMSAFVSNIRVKNIANNEE